MSGLLQDLRYALRQFRKSPGFAAGAILSLALGIGAATTLFSVVYGVLLDPFPYKDAKHIAYAGLLNASGHYSPLFVAGGHWGDVLSATAVVEVLFQQPDAYRNLTGESIPLTVHAGVLSPGAFHFLGVPALVGRAFTTADAPGGNPAPLAVLSHRFWMEHYLGNRSVIGKTLELDHTPYTVIGVMPPRFVWFGSDVYLPGKPSADPHEFWMTFLRLKPGTARLAAEAEMQALVNGFAKEDPESYGKSPRVKILSLHEEWLGESRGTLAALFAAALLLLLIGCANISILLLARGAARQQEFAVRTSLGAGRGRLIRQLLTESIVISTGGAALGALAAWWGVHATPGILPDELLPQEVAIQMNLPVLLFSAASAALTGILFGLSPALEFSRPRAGRVLQGGGAQTADRSRARTMHRLPIAGQVALTLLLLAGAGGAAKAFLSKLHALQGFDPGHVFMISFEFPLPAGMTRPERFQKVLSKEEAIRQAVAQTPGVAEAGYSSVWDPGGFGSYQKIEIQSRPALASAQAVFTPVSPQLLSVLHVPLLSGRIFSSADVPRLSHVALVNQSFVKQYLAGSDPIGQRVRFPHLKRWDSPPLSSQPLDDWAEIIGVVGDVTNDNLDHPQVRPAILMPNSFGPPILGGTLYVRASADTETAMRSARARLRQVSADAVISGTRTLQWELDNWGWGRERLIAAIFGLYAGVALILAAMGLYGVVSFAVKLRTRELGIRMALGAPRGAVVQLVLHSTAAMLALGIAGGLAISAMVGPLVAAWGAGGLSQPLTLLAAAAVLALVAGTASVVPAWRAGSIDPIKALRAE